MNSSINNSFQNKYTVVIVHILLWSMILLAPYFFMDRETIFRWDMFLRSSPEMLGWVLIFYINYFVLIDKFLFKGKYFQFIAFNVLLIIGMLGLTHYGNDIIRSLGQPQMRRRRMRVSPWFFFIKNATTLITMVGLSVALKMTYQWFIVENERKELEKAKSDAELQNLKNQISPHFLLNTLNNIYALIAFNPEKAQQSVLDLSKLLRYILYDNEKTYVPLHQEINFIKNYLDLMRIRLSDNVTLEAKFSVCDNSNTPIAPLIYISLIENAFKHGISSDKNSFISFYFQEHSDGKIEFISQNSYYPKSTSDKSGSGIGLELVKKRLELIYPNRYKWETEITDKVYSTTLIIETKG